MEGLNKFCEIKTIILEIFGKIFVQTRETVEYKYINTRQTELLEQCIVVNILASLTFHLFVRGGIHYHVCPLI